MASIYIANRICIRWIGIRKGFGDSFAWIYRLNSRNEIDGFLLNINSIYGCNIFNIFCVSKKFPNWDAAFIFIIVISLTTPSLLSEYNEAFPDIPKEDYLLLANLKEEKSDISGAVKYLEKYQAMVTDCKIIKQVEDKIVNLNKNQIVTRND